MKTRSPANTAFTMRTEDLIVVKVSGRTWTKVESFDRSTRRDAHFVLDRESGQLLFGDGSSGRRPAKGAKIEVSYRAGSGNVVLQGKRLCGIYRGVVVSNADPQQQNRLKVSAPEAGISSLWAVPCAPSGPVVLPRDGAGVWIAFEGGERDRPVWLGVTGN